MNKEIRKQANEIFKYIKRNTRNVHDCRMQVYQSAEPTPHPQAYKAPA